MKISTTDIFAGYSISDIQNKLLYLIKRNGNY